MAKSLYQLTANDDQSIYRLVPDINGLKVHIADSSWYLTESPLKMGDLVLMGRSSVLIISSGRIWQDSWRYDVWDMRVNRKTFVSLADYHFKSFLRVLSRVL